MILDAFQERDPGVAPVEALRLLMHRLVADDRPILRFSEGSRRYVETIAASETLKARAICDEFAVSLAAALAGATGRPGDNADAHLAASLLLATWSVAFIQAHDAYRRNGDVGEAKAIFLAIVDRGSSGVAAAMTVELDVRSKVSPDCQGTGGTRAGAARLLKTLRFQ